MTSLIESLLLVEPDLTAILLQIGREWIKRNYPESRFASLVVDTGENTPVTRVIITSSETAAVAQ